MRLALCEQALRHVNVIGGKVEGSYWAGGIAGRNYGTIEYCSFSGSVHGSQDFVGGIVSDNHTGGILRYCYTARLPDGTTETEVKGKQIAGGIAGRNSTGSKIESCCNTAYVTTDDGFIHNIGGIAGKNETGSTVYNCYYEEGSVYRGDMSNGSGNDGVGTNAATGRVERVEEKTENEFKSGEVDWELSQGESGGVWGQNLTGENEDAVDEHPIL